MPAALNRAAFAAVSFLISESKGASPLDSVRPNHGELLDTLGSLGYHKI